MPVWRKIRSLRDLGLCSLQFAHSRAAGREGLGPGSSVKHHIDGAAGVDDVSSGW